MEISDLAGPVSPETCLAGRRKFGGAEVLGGASDEPSFIGFSPVEPVQTGPGPRKYFLLLVSFLFQYNLSES